METTRKSLEAEIAKRFEEWERIAEETRAKLDETADNVEEGVVAKWNDAKERQRKLKDHVANLRDAGDEAWDDVKDGISAALEDVENAWEDVRNGFASAVDRFTDKSNDAADSQSSGGITQ